MGEWGVNRLRLLLVDDHEVVRLGLITLLDDVPWVDVVAEAGTADEALSAVEEHQPDVIVMDIRLPGESGLEACREITRRWPEKRVIVLTSYADDELIFRAREANACSYVLKQVGNRALIEALEKVRRNEAFLDPVGIQREINTFHHHERTRYGHVFKDLTDREMIILARIADGMTNAQVAAELSVSEQTVCNDVNSILAKLDLSNRFAAAIYAIRNNINYYLPESSS